MENDIVLGKIVKYVTNKNLTTHQLILNLYKITQEEIPVLPPIVCRCEIIVQNGKKYNAILEQMIPPFYCGEDANKDGYFWKVLSTNPNKRYNFKLSDVVEWKFI